MKQLPGGYQTVGAINISGGVLFLACALWYVVSPAEDKHTGAELLTAGFVGLTGLGLVFAGLGLRRGQHYWGATRVLLFVLAPLLLIQGLWFGWEMLRELLWPTDAQSPLAIFFLPPAAAVVLWSAVLGVVGVRIGRYLGIDADAPNKPLQI
jgi:hypothetical protein